MKIFRRVLLGTALLLSLVCVSALGLLNKAYAVSIIPEELCNLGAGCTHPDHPWFGYCLTNGMPICGCFIGAWHPDDDFIEMDYCYKGGTS